MSVIRDEIGPLHQVAANLVRVNGSVAAGVSNPQIDVSTGELTCPLGVVGRLPYGYRKAVQERALRGWRYTVDSVSVCLWNEREAAVTVVLLGTPCDLVSERAERFEKAAVIWVGHCR